MLTEYLKLPKCVHLIITMEFCERFCFYGMRTILILYLVEFLNISPNKSTSIFHIFIFLCYISPLIGAFLADGVCGKYWTIVVLSSVYVVGCVLLTVSSAVVNARWILAMTSLVIIATGTGGIKPCVNTFGGEQIPAENHGMLEAYFAAFYLVINIGSLLSTAISPILRAEIRCFGHDCYSAAFGTMTILMVLALAIFLGGTKYYRNRGKNQESAAYVVRCIGTSFVRSIKQTPNAGKHWLYRSSDKYSDEKIHDVRCLLNMFKIFLPIPVFWSLFDQMGSRWTLQAVEMDGRVGPITVKPDQMQALNSILVMLFVPFFQTCVYPVFTAKNMMTKPLTRMLIGMIFAVGAFMNAATLEYAIQQNAEKSPESLVKIVNFHECSIVDQHHAIHRNNVHSFARSSFSTNTFFETCGNSSVTLPKSSLPGFDLLVFHGDSKTGLQLTKVPSGSFPRANKGKTWIRILAVGNFSGSKIRVQGNEAIDESFAIGPNLQPTSYVPLDPNEYIVSMIPPNLNFRSKHYFRNGASYTFVVFHAENPGSSGILIINQSDPTALSILWQIPQYVLITIAEVLFAVTGMRFVFDQAPKSMKSIVSSGWLTTTAVGNAFVAVIIQTHLFGNQIFEYLFFAGLMLIASGIFAVLARFYTGQQDCEIGDDSEKPVPIQ